MEYAVGAVLAIGIGFFGTVSRFDRERSFYSVMVVVVASFYVLFGVLGASAPILAAEVAGLIIFASIAVIGFRTDLWLVAAALFGHGLFDIAHARIVTNPGVPIWWPGFCASFDIVIAAYMAWRLSPLAIGQRLSSATEGSFAARIWPFVEHELREATTCRESGQSALGFAHLERAHVLAQMSTILHIRVHIRMLQWAAQKHDWRELLGQLLRIAGASVTTPFGLVPVGNTGGSNVPPLKTMPVADDLARLIAAAMDAK